MATSGRASTHSCCRGGVGAAERGCALESVRASNSALGRALGYVLDYALD